MALETSKLIYCIDDDSFTREIMGLRLEALGYEIETFSSPEAFLKAIKLKKPDLCFIDINIDGYRTGLLLIQALRNVYGEDPPIIAISADSTNSTIADAINCGADDYLLKPVRQDTIHDVLEKVFSGDKHFSDHMHNVPNERKLTSLKIEIEIMEIDVEGILLQSTALLAKGTRLELQGEIQKLMDTSDPVKVVVVQNWALGETKKFGSYATFENLNEHSYHKILSLLDSAT